MRIGNTARFAACCALLLLAACRAHNNIPVAGFTTATGPANVMRVFVDANGDFYPEHWDRYFSASTIERVHSLRLHPDQDNTRAEQLRRARAEQLAAVERLAAGKRRVFILIHGFNNTQQSAEDAYAIVLARLPLTHDDAVIQFHWDGGVGSGAGRGIIWFPAVANSQIAGTHSLRPILNRIAGKPVYLITHSRGASVALSALGDPAYTTTFRTQTTNLFGSDFFEADPLVENGKQIHAVFLAPAIGNPDFWDEDCGPGCSEYRTFSPQLKSIRYTVNPDDPVLDKLFGGRLASSFNATDLGYDAGVGNSLKTKYPFMTGYPIHMNAHGFNEYASHQVLAAMLTDSGVQDVR